MNQADQRAAILAAYDLAVDCMADRTEIADELLRVANGPLEIELMALRRSLEQAREEIKYLNEHVAELLAAKPAPPTTSPYTIVANWCQERADTMRTTVSTSTDPNQQKYEPVLASISTLEETANYCRRMLGEPALPPIPPELLHIGELLRTQNNRITDQPMFLVQKSVYDATTDDYADGFEWHDNINGMLEDVSELRSKRLESLYHRGREYDERYVRIATRQRWEFVTACFTEQGCKDYLARDGHNLGEARIYADGSYRNHEYRVVRNWLMSLPPPSGVAGGAS